MYKNNQQRNLTQDITWKKHIEFLENSIEVKNYEWSINHK